MKRIFFLTMVIMLVASGMSADTAQETGKDSLLSDALTLLKFRKDNQALVILDQILLAQPDNPDALSAKAEVLRRQRDYAQAQKILEAILSKNPNHLSSLARLAFVKYNQGDFKKVINLSNRVINSGSSDKDSKALAYILISMVNGSMANNGGILQKIKYGTKIKSYLQKAKELAPDLPEASLGMGTFYLLAPSFVGGNLNSALSELEYTVKIAPSFCAANARLAQAYKKKSLQDKCDFYIHRAQALDPQNEILREMKENK